MSRPDYYAILSLPNRPALSTRDLKNAYRRALLAHHPDKKSAPSASSCHDPSQSPSRTAAAASQSTQPSIDDITAAYRTLASPSLRASYDRASFLSQPRLDNDKARHRHDEAFRTGLETLDLDDLEYDEKRELWFHPCRCGQERGFVLIGEELEREEQSGEVVVGCAGCSLWIRVLFGVADENDEAAQGAGGSGTDAAG